MPGKPEEPEQLVLRMLEVVCDRVESIQIEQRSTFVELREIKASLPLQRRRYRAGSRAFTLMRRLSRHNGLCPCCQEAPVCNESGRLDGRI